MYKVLSLFILILTSLMPALAQQLKEIQDWKKYYQEAGMEGGFALYNINTKVTYVYNLSLYREGFLPASTFKICNSLIGLETGVIKDENFLIKWDGMNRRIPAWNKDQDLKEAYKNSTVWYYQELARRVGGKDMKYWLNSTKYGNTDTTGGIDQFWLTGQLRITLEEQIDFLKRLYLNQLPFSQRSMDIVKKIMIREITPQYTIRSKTGWINSEGSNNGWYVGYVEKKDNVYFFANYINDPDASDPDFADKRIEISNQILKSMKILP